MMLSGFILSLSCTRTENPGRVMTDNENLPIKWDVQISEEFRTIPSKALVEDYYALRNACTSTEEHSAEKIGIFGSYILDGNRTVVFEDTDLWWWNKEDGNPFDDSIGEPSMWNYDGEDVYWVEGATYTFKAYFPKSKVVLEPGSNSELLLTVYDSQSSQFDLMTTGKTTDSTGENPVPLIFRHTLAALKFNFKFKSEGITDNLTELWLENIAENGLYTRATLNFGDDINWPRSTPDPIGSRMYLWKPSSPLQIRSDEYVAAYSTSAISGVGNQYTENGGWLLVIPQSCQGPETLNLCFRTSTGGEATYRVGLPVMEFLPGKRYTFNINISSTQIDLELGIADWNERESSHEIDFNI